MNIFAENVLVKEFQEHLEVITAVITSYNVIIYSLVNQ